MTSEPIFFGMVVKDDFSQLGVFGTLLKSRIVRLMTTL